MPVTVHLVRHAQGVHNLCRENEVLHDPLLTDLGRQQCADLNAKFPHHDKLTGLFASPLRRTLDTCLLSFSSKDVEEASKHPKVVAIPELQEVSDAPCDTGSDPAIIKKEFEGLVDFSRVYDGWNSIPDWTSLAEKIVAVADRGRRARLILKEYVQDLPDGDHVAVVSHGAFLHFLTQDYHGVEPHRATSWSNTEYRSFHFAAADSADDVRLVETDESWQRRHGDAPRPTEKDQEKLREVYFGQLTEYVAPPAHGNP